MKLLRKIIFYTFLAGTLTTLVFAFWLFWRTPNQETIKTAFPANSYNIYKTGNKLTVYSLATPSQGEQTEKFQDYFVLGKTDISNRSFQKLIKHSFSNDVANSPGEGAACFLPRHGLKVSDGDETIEILICYECGNFISFHEDNKGEGGLIGTSKVILDKVLSDANIELGGSY